MPQSTHKTYEFGPFRLVMKDHLLVRNGRSVSLRPKEFEVLVCLLEHSGHLVDKDELMQRVWPDSIVEEGNLSRTIWALRNALGEAGKGNKYIQTVPKRGYRFVANVCVNEKEPSFVAETNVGATPIKAAIHVASVEIAPALPASPTAKNRWTSRPAVFGGLVLAIASVLTIAAWSILGRKPAVFPQISSVAVLPFRPLDANSRDESLEMGMAETLITRLGSIRQLTVRPLGSVIKFAESDTDPIAAGRETEVDVVLTGSLQKAGDRLRVSVRLVDVRTGDTLWSEKFNETFTDVFKVQDAIAERMANALLLQLTAGEKEQLTKRYTNDPEAWQLYLQGKRARDRRSGDWNEECIELFTKAIEKDPDFALAHATLADAYRLRNAKIGKMSYEEMIPKVREHLAKAFELDGALAEAYAASAEVKYQYAYDWAGAERDYKRAVQLNPNSAWIHWSLGFMFRAAGKFDEADAEFRKALELEPDIKLVRNSQCGLLSMIHRDDEALECLLQRSKDNPETGGIYPVLSEIYQKKGRDAEAFDALLRGMVLGRYPQSQIDEAATAYRDSGLKGGIRQFIASIKARSQTEYVSPMTLACLYTRVGDKENAFKYIEKSLAVHDGDVVGVKAVRCYDGLRDDPRYSKILQRINLTN